MHVINPYQKSISELTNVLDLVGSNIPQVVYPNLVENLPKRVGQKSLQEARPDPGLQQDFWAPMKRSSAVIAPSREEYMMPENHEDITIPLKNLPVHPKACPLT